MTNLIAITKLPNGNYEVSGPTGEKTEQFEMASNVISAVRIRLNYLRLPNQPKEPQR